MTIVTKIFVDYSFSDYVMWVGWEAIICIKAEVTLEAFQTLRIVMYTGLLLAFGMLMILYIYYVPC